ncbi:MAG: type I-MYXAN CRISPR-associated protein Cas6/Cmx6 [Candidatus Thiodiazotropha sp.]
MFWKEEIDEERFVVPEDVVDVIFKIHCPTLPIDHAWSLSDAIHQALPWFSEEPRAGLHLIHGADSKNGWERPSNSDALLYLSRRTPLILRLPRERVDDALSRLSGQSFELVGHKMQIGEGHTRLLGTTSTLYCRHMVVPGADTEEAFLEAAVEMMNNLNLSYKKVLCGKGTEFKTPEGSLSSQSLMVAGLPLDDAITLQEEGLGPMRNRGFGLFIPHKTV